MILTILLSLSVGFSGLPKVDIKDLVIKKSISIYLDSLSANINNTPIVIQVIQNKKNKTIFISEAPSIGWFENNLPESYAHYNNNFIFIFNASPKSNSDITYEEFLNQFKYLFDSIRPVSISDQLKSNPVGTIKFKTNDTIIGEIKNVEMFPDRKFYKEGLNYDEDEAIKYEDGFYHVASIEDYKTPPIIDSEDPFKPIRESGILSIHEFDSCIISFLIGVNKFGEVENAKMTIDNCIISKKKMDDLKKIILSTKGWYIGLINEKPVCYKMLIRI